MEIILYKYDGYKNKINKDMESAFKFCTLSNVVLKEETSLLNPSLLVDLNDLIHVLSDDQKRVGYVYEVDGKYNHAVYTKAVSDLCSCNYLYIKEFNRYYFIEDISIFRTNLWRLRCHVDVLHSYSSILNDRMLYVLRYEKANSKLYKDDLATFYPYKNIEEIIPSDGSLVNTQFDLSSLIGEYHYTVTVINDRTDSGILDSKDSISILPKVTGQYLFSPCVNSYILFSYDRVLKLGQELTLTDNSKLASGVISLIQYPMELKVKGLAEDKIRILTSNVDSNIEAYSISPKNFIVADFIYNNSNVSQDLYPDTEVQLFIPYVGWTQFNAQDILNKRIIVTYDVNYSTGESIVSVIDYELNRLLYTSQCQLGRKLSITSSNQNEVQANTISQAMSLGVSAITTGIGIMSANPLAVVGGVMSLGKSLVNFGTNQMTNYLKTSGQVSSVIGGNVLPQKVRIKISYPGRTNRTKDFAHQFGYPYNEMAYIKGLSDDSFFICSDVQLNGFDTATSSELTEIKSLLESGVYK